jgi:hypothetical protein
MRPLSLALLLAFTALPALAEDTVTRLTDDNVKAFIDRTTEVTNKKAEDLGGAEAKAYFEAHLHPNARFMSKMTYVIPGYPDKEAELSLDKTQFLDSLAGGSEAVEKYSNKVEVKDVKIASSGKTATVATESVEEGVMDVEGQQVPIVGKSKCNQILMLSDDGIIQMFNANCKTEIGFKEE